MTPRESNPPPADSRTAQRVLRTAAKGGCLPGAIGFIVGFVGPIIFAPDSPQSPMLGIFFTGLVGFMLGAAGMLAMLGTALMARTYSQALPIIVLVILGGPVIGGIIVGAIQPRQVLLWSTSFSLPMLVSGLFCLLLVLFEGPGMLIWLLAAIIMATLSVLGALLARRLRQWLALR